MDRPINHQATFFRLIKQVTIDYWFMLLLIFLMKAGQYMLLPYLALYLLHTTQASTTAIGLVVGMGPLAYGLSGPLNGYWIDRFGRRNAIIFSIFMAGIVFIIFNLNHTIIYYAVMNIGVGISRSLFDTASRSYKLHAMTVEEKRFGFALRFMATNAGGGIGPLIGMFFIQNNAIQLFIINGCIFLIFSVLIYCYFKNMDDFNEALIPPKIIEVFKAMAMDLRLCSIVFAALFMWISYAQLDSIFGIYLVKAFHHGAQILTWTFVVNTTGCIVLQIPVSHWIQSLSEKRKIILGSGMYSLGFLIIPFAHHVSILLLASLFVVLGEVIIAPLIDLLIYQRAPKNMLSSYYGALALSILGVGIGPIIGGYFYQYSNVKILFLFCMGLFILMGFLLAYAVKPKIQSLPIKN